MEASEYPFACSISISLRSCLLNETHVLFFHARTIAQSFKVKRQSATPEVPMEAKMAKNKRYPNELTIWSGIGWGGGALFLLLGYAAENAGITTLVPIFGFTALFLGGVACWDLLKSLSE